MFKFRNSEINVTVNTTQEEAVNLFCEVARAYFEGRNKSLIMDFIGDLVYGDKVREELLTEYFGEEWNHEDPTVVDYCCGISWEYEHSLKYDPQPSVDHTEDIEEYPPEADIDEDDKDVEEDNDDEMPVKPSRKSRRRDNRKSAPHKPGTSCFRKGYHKSERDWKRSERRKNRREGRQEVRDKDTIIPDISAIQDWLLSPIYFNESGLVEEAFYVEVSVVKNNDGKIIGVDVLTDYEVWSEEEGEEDYYEGGHDEWFIDMKFLEYKGLVE